MSYKTILIHCNDKRRIDALLAPAVRLAETFQAHLIGLSVVPPIAVMGGGVPGAPPMVVDGHCQLYRSENPALRAAFDDAVRGRGFSAEWIDDDAGTFNVADCVLPHARTADLVVASQTDPEWPGSGRLDIADRLAMESGRPVLILPNAGVCEQVGHKILVAWNGRREAARAMFDALPLLRLADAIKVIWINPQSWREAALTMPVGEVCIALSRHGVKCEATEEVPPSGGVGETLVRYAKDWDADLVVMGCYGHTRFRELVFGGTSRYLLAHMSLPLLMSH